MLQSCKGLLVCATGRDSFFPSDDSGALLKRRRLFLLMWFLPFYLLVRFGFDLDVPFVAFTVAF
jgi:hypothetical protein